MSGYHGSPAGYLNPVAVDRIQHPDFDARVAENTVMRTVQYLYPIIHDYMIMLKGLCEATEVQLPTELDDHIDFLKQVSESQIDWQPRAMLGDDAANELNARLSLHEEWSAQEDNSHHSITNWENPYGDNNQLQQPPPQQQMNPYQQQQMGMNPYGQQPMMQQGGASMYKPWTWFGIGTGAAATQPQAWQMPPPQIDTLSNGEQYYTANGGGPPPLAVQQGYTTLPVGAIGWNMAGQPIDFNGMVVATTSEKLVNSALTHFL
tara:strand:+ start:508 stop:1293 length:786 start_codon:yes stop_codon:yes gene_type:complete